jgi:hypothetical protein
MFVHERNASKNLDMRYNYTMTVRNKLSQPIPCLLSLAHPPSVALHGIEPHSWRWALLFIYRNRKAARKTACRNAVAHTDLQGMECEVYYVTTCCYVITPARQMRQKIWCKCSLAGTGISQNQCALVQIPAPALCHVALSFSSTHSLP